MEPNKEERLFEEASDRTCVVVVARLGSFLRGPFGSLGPLGPLGCRWFV